MLLVLQQTSCMEPFCVFSGCFSVLNQVSAASVVQQNAATLFNCEAPELFCGRRHFTDFMKKLYIFDELFLS